MTPIHIITLFIKMYFRKFINFARRLAIKYIYADFIRFQYLIYFSIYFLNNINGILYNL